MVTQAHYLLMLAEDARQKGDELAEEMRQRGIAHAQEVIELARLIDRARDIIEHEKQRYAQYLPDSPTNQAPPKELATPRVVVRKASE
jgi:hypothetical protein